MTKPRGRPRSTEADAAILKAAIQQAHDLGFRSMSIDSISAASGVAKTTIYRRWPNKAAIVMDAFLLELNPFLGFPEKETTLESIRSQMQALAKVFRGRFGKLTCALLAEAQFNAELADAFRNRWILPRRVAAKVAISEAIRRRELRPEVDLDATIDALYGIFYYRLMIGTGPLSSNYINTVFSQVMDGVRRK